MTEIATEASLSRAWLYKNFPDKSSLIVAALVQTDEVFWAGAHARVPCAYLANIGPGHSCSS